MRKLIVEMNMQKNCNECEAKCVSALYGRICGMTRKNIIPFLDKPNRPDWCPIVGVLPDEHGDLIDRDELFETIKSRVTLIDSCPEGKPSMKELFERDVLCTCLHDVVCAKAVIAAERKDDEKTRSNTPS